MSLRRPVAGLLRCEGAVASVSTPKFFCDGPVVAARCKFRSCTYTSVSLCPMSHSWFSRLWVQAGLGPQLRVRVLGPCPCASQISWLVAVYEYPGRVRATAPGPCPCVGQEGLQRCKGAVAKPTRSGVPSGLLRNECVEEGEPGRCPEGGWPGSRWGWGEYGVLTCPRVISPTPKNYNHVVISISMTPCVISPLWTRLDKVCQVASPSVMCLSAVKRCANRQAQCNTAHHEH